MRQAEKLAAIGLLAAGIAHEINNPLGNILGYAKLLMRESDISVGQREKLEVIVEQAKRGNEIVRGLLDFSRQSRPAFASVSMNEVILKALKSLSNQIDRQGIKLVTNLTKIPMVEGDPKQIEQVVVNLLLNSIQAFEDMTDRTISIETGYTDSGVEVRVIDNGHGIPEEILPRIFDPFFTTKPVGKGVGLGLSICLGIIKDHDGSIHVESEKGKGSKFSFHIPAMSA